MSALDVLRQTARALLPGDCFLRRDQQLRALFVTDFPRKNANMAASARESLLQGGFEITEEKGLWLLDLNEAARRAFIDSLPKPELSEDMPLPCASLCRSLLHDGPTSAQLQPWEPIRRTLLRLDAKETHLLVPELRLICARCKRQKQPLPTAIVSLLNDKEAPHAD